MGKKALITKTEKGEAKLEEFRTEQQRHKNVMELILLRSQNILLPSVEAPANKEMGSKERYHPLLSCQWDVTFSQHQKKGNYQYFWEKIPMHGYDVLKDNFA